jgi:hypothetical protein
MTAREGFMPWAAFEDRLQRLEAAVSQRDGAAVRAIVERDAGLRREARGGGVLEGAVGPTTLSATRRRDGSRATP